jgi:hypothetical protein
MWRVQSNRDLSCVLRSTEFDDSLEWSTQDRSLFVRRAEGDASWSDLDKAVSRAQRRYTESINALTRVRRQQAPKVLSEVTTLVRPRDVPTIPYCPGGSPEPRT